MKISTKGRYALRVMLDLAEHNTGAYLQSLWGNIDGVTLADIPTRSDSKRCENRLSANNSHGGQIGCSNLAAMALI